MTTLLLDRRRFLQQLSLGLAGCGVAGSRPASWPAPPRTVRLPRSLPEVQGVASSGILDFVHAIEAGGLSLHSLMVVRHGQVVAEGWWAPYAADLKHTLYSLSKSFTATAVGLAVDERRLQLDDRVVSFFPSDVPDSISPHLAAMRVEDLLMMASGHAENTLPGDDRVLPEGSWAKAVLAQPVAYAPGTHFAYNNGATYLLSAILQKVTGQTLLAYLTPRLFSPLGIEGADWEASPQGIRIGAWGLRVKTEDIAKLGQLYLQQGVWAGEPLLPEAWVQQATHRQIQTAEASDEAARQTSDWAQGYGYQFWRCRHSAYRGDGALGQFCIVLPEEDAAIAITAEVADMQAVLDEVWGHLLPALQGVGLTSDRKAQASLTEKLASLTLPLPAGQARSPEVGEKGRRIYAIDENSLDVRRVGLDFQPSTCTFTMQDAAGTHQITCGIGRWIEGETGLTAVPLKLLPTRVPGEATSKIAAGGAWRDEQTFVMHWRFIETAHYDQVTCRFEADRLRVAFKRSLAVLNPEAEDVRPVLVGKRAA